MKNIDNFDSSEGAVKDDLQFIEPDWPAPAGVKAVTSTRVGGVSEQPYTSFNLALHVGDNLHHVQENRAHLARALAFDRQPFWLQQVHSNTCIPFKFDAGEPVADASFSDNTGEILAVMTADCLPILFCDLRGNWIAACHAGWRGLLNGVIENTLACYPGKATELMAWIGPAISQNQFEVGAEVRADFVNLDPKQQNFFEANENQRYQFDLIGLAKHKLEEKGVAVYDGQHCTFSQDSLFYSYRRDGETGRMASLIWIEKAMQHKQ